MEQPYLWLRLKRKMLSLDKESSQSHSERVPLSLHFSVESQPCEPAPSSKPSDCQCQRQNTYCDFFLFDFGQGMKGLKGPCHKYAVLGRTDSEAMPVSVASPPLKNFSR